MDNSVGYVLLVAGGVVGVAALFGKLPLWTLLIAFPAVLYGSVKTGGLGPGAVNPAA